MKQPSSFDLLKIASLLALLLLAIGVWLLSGWFTPSSHSALPQVSADRVTTALETPAETRAASADSSEQLLQLGQAISADEIALAPQQNAETYLGKKPELPQFPTYIVERGDTPISISEKFGIEPETLLGGNPRLGEEAGMLQTGTELIILPINGVLHDVQPGETLESISSLYGIPTEEIIAYQPNNLEFPYRVYPETKLIVPGAVREVFKWDPPKLANTGSFGGSQARPLIVGTGTFIWPLTGRITQEYWYGHQAIDIGIPEGNPVYASDTGTITYASWSPYCYGNLVVIDHGNGSDTLYAHLSGFNVYVGQIVYQGNIVGYSGNTGCSSGPHLHFELRWYGNRDNPFFYLP